METTDTNQIEQTPQTEELSHSDKMIGVFTEPSNMFKITSYFPPRTKDWIIPLLIVFVLIGVVRSISMMNEEVYYEAKQQAIERVEKMIESGTIPQDQEDAMIENVNSQMEMMRGPVGWIINIVSTIIFGSIFFFIIAGIYFLLVKFVLKGNGSYQHVLVANGLTAYITMIQVILAGILTLMLGKIVQDTSLAALMGTDRSTLAGFFLAKIDPISIWAYAVLSIGLAKLFKSDDVKKYYLVVFGLWI
ncbi:MAG: YIP1 family protein, partial [Ignavibacteriaceae bacterium]|nr:YIP1 family protein [Ignavibacteriaceae bacterium]